MKKKSAISLISYDANMFLADSIKRYCNYVDEIIPGIDKDRITWSGNDFSIDEDSLWSSLSQIDGDNKISIIEENFHQSEEAIETTTMKETFSTMFTSDWIFSFDADEMLVNTKKFFLEYCPLVENYYNKADICMVWATPYKKTK